MECPRCGYALGPFEEKCPRCERFAEEGKLPPSPPVPSGIPTFSCISCKAPVPKGEAVCPNCGLNYGEGGNKPVQPQAESPPELSFTCPVCKSDQTTSVSAIVRSGQPQASKNLSKNQSIAQMLAPPERRVYVSRARMVVLLTLLGCGIAVFLASASFPSSRELIAIAMAIVAAVIILLGLQWDAGCRERFERLEGDIHQAAMREWNALIYCSRCDHVYNGRTGRAERSDQAHRLLDREAAG